MIQDLLPVSRVEGRIPPARTSNMSQQPVLATLSRLTQTPGTQAALVTITLRFPPSPPTETASYHYLKHLRKLIRNTDESFLLDNTYFFLLPGANLQGGAIVQERLWEALLLEIHNTTEQVFPQPYHATIGHSAYPLPSSSVQQCLHDATTPQRLFTPQQDSTNTYQPIHNRPPKQFHEHGIPYLSLLPRRKHANNTLLITRELAQQFHCVPLGRERDKLTVAIADPRDRQGLKCLEQTLGLHIFPVLTDPNELQLALERFL